jgi:S1-C subfamily serine protease
MNTVYKKCLFSLLTVIGLLSVNGENTVNAEQRSIAAPMSSTFRIRTRESRGNSIITGHGTGFAINLSEFGYNKHRYVMTACHVIREHNGKLAPNLQLELRLRTGVRWARCRVVASDAKMDVAVLECETDLPVCARFADQDATARTRLVMIGSPAGVPLRAVRGYVTQMKRIEPSVAYVGYIQEGCSGGPVFEANSQHVIGLCIAGIGNGQNSQMDPHTCLYVSQTNMKRFLHTALRSSDCGARRNYAMGSERNYYARRSGDFSPVSNTETGARN